MNMTPTNDEFSASVSDSATDPPIRSLDLPTYVCSLLENAGYQNAGTLALQMETDREVILAIKGIGPKTLEQIEAAVKSHAVGTIVEQITPIKEATEPDQVSESKVETVAKKDLKKKNKNKEQEAKSKKKVKKAKKTKKKGKSKKKEKKEKKKSDKSKKKKAKKRRDKKSKKIGVKDKKNKGKKSKKTD